MAQLRSSDEVADTPMAAASEIPQLQPARWWHLAALAQLERELFPADPWSVETFVAELAAGRLLQVAIDEHGQPRGYVDVAVNGRDADLMTIAVERPSAGQGWGRALLSWACQQAEAAGAERMLLEVRSGNTAEQLYRRAGFERIDVRRRYYPDGGDAIVMVKSLVSRPGRSEGGLVRNA